MQQTTKKIESQNIPAEISEYIRKFFDESFLIDITKIKENDGSFYFNVEVSQDNIINHLKFNEKGSLIKTEIEPVIPIDPHEDLFGEEEFYEGNY